MAASVSFRDSKSLGDLLGGDERVRLIVPEFQRGYNWKDKQVRAFWKDIVQFQKEAAEDDGPDEYFLGPIVLQAGGKIGNIREVRLLDGQQRLASATILLSVLRDAARDTKIQAGTDLARDIHKDFIHKNVAGFSLCLGETDIDFFRETIQSDPPQVRKPLIGTHSNIIKARDFFRDSIRRATSALESIETVAFLNDLKNIIKTDLVVACIPVQTERDAFKIFETLNDRGLKLGPADLLLNFLMRIAQPDQRPAIRRYWTKMVERMGKRDIKKFLRATWISRYGDLKSKDLFTALKDQIEESNKKDKTKIDSLEYVKTCSDECNQYLEILTVSKELGDARERVKNLIHDVDCEPAMPLLISAYQVLRPSQFEQVVRLVLVFVVRHSVIAGLDPADMEDVLYKLAKEIRERMKDKEKQESAGKRCVGNVKKELVEASPSEDVIRAAMPDVFLSSEEEATYVFTRLADKAISKTKELRLEIEESSLEHIFPQTLKETDWGGPDEHKVLEPFLMHIGNLTMLGRKLNEQAGQKEFAEKKIEYAKSEIETVKDILREFPGPEWNESTIRQRAANLTDSILSVWSFDNASRV